MFSRKKRREKKQLADLAKLFDAKYYLDNNLDIQAAGVDPTWHYLHQGWREGRSPNDWFDGPTYLNLNADVAALGINPLLHYVRYGRAEGRAFVWQPGMAGPRPHGKLRTLIEQARPARELAAHYSPFPPSERLSPESLASMLLASSSRGVVLSFSHDDYAANLGGVQRLVGVEVEHYRAAHWGYLHIAPAQPLPTLSDEKDPSSFDVRLRLNDELIGTINAAGLIEAVERIKAHGVVYDLIVHHFMGHSPEIIQTICARLQIEFPYVWVHDFFTLCEGYNLLRNNWKFCSAPRVESMGCQLCVHGSGRVAHFDRMRHFFALLQPMVLAPSAAALQIWQGRGLASRDVRIVPIAQLVTSAAKPERATRASLRVAFIGQSWHVKGWTTYRDLVSQSKGQHNLEFWHLGVQSDETSFGSGIRHVPVHADRKDRDVMIRALAEHRIDIVVLWPAWPETFSYVVHEALAAGAAIVTHQHAGNIVPVLHAQGHGRSLVLESETELFALFASAERLDQLVSTPREQGVVLPYESSAHVTLHHRMVEQAPARSTVESYVPAERAYG